VEGVWEQKLIPAGGDGENPGSKAQCPAIFTVALRKPVRRGGVAQLSHENQMSVLTGAIADGWFGMIYDPERKKYVSYCRPRDRYEGGGYKSPGDADFLPNDSKHSIYAGVVRRIGRMERDALWTQEEAWSRTVFLPDEVDQQNGITSHMMMMMRC